MESVQLHHVAQLRLTQRPALFAFKHGEAYAAFCFQRIMQSSGVTRTCIYFCPSGTVTVCDLQHRLQAATSFSGDKVTNKTCLHISFALTEFFWVICEFFLILSFLHSSKKALTTIPYPYLSISRKHLPIHLSNVKSTQGMIYLANFRGFLLKNSTSILFSCNLMH